jgi:phosphatidate phosphatase APP1
LFLACLAIIVSSISHKYVSDDEAVLLFTTSAHLDVKNHLWQIPVHGWIFERESDSWWRTASQEGILEILSLSDADPNGEILKRRLEMFLVDNERNKTLTVHFHGQSYSVGPSGANGHFHGLINIPPKKIHADPVTSTIQHTSVVITAKDGRQFKGRIQLLPAKGVCVISDIDDTIKVSHVLDKNELIANTFLREFRPIPGMADVYSSWAKQGAAFHYVSASPWQLYPELNRFINQFGFPQGDIQLRYFRIKDRSFFAFLQASSEYKIQTIDALIKRFPQRKFILVGDSGENDPAIYAAVAKAYPEKIIKIYIRLILPDSDHRQQTGKHFKNLPKNRWELFQSGRQLKEVAPKLSDCRACRRYKEDGVPL